MKTFENIKFKWTFRDYQQRVLDNVDIHINDGKVNIVAAPGSGKTILGLELIRRLGNPCLILSPTTTIRQQWGERFEEAFLENENVDDYVSFDLTNVKLITSITYQALHSSMNKVACIDDEEENIDYSDIDILKLIKSNKIKTICLDEAHHLQNEWQKALEKFISMLSKDIKIISLTATPPYDANLVEWRRYTSICGEIDEEIEVPELVKTNTLCPHQDYIYFNYPTQDELLQFKEYTQKAYELIGEVVKMPMIIDLCNTLNATYSEKYDDIYSNAKEYIALLSLFEYAGFTINKKLVRCLVTKNNLPKFTLELGEIALQFLTTSNALSDENKEDLLNLIKENSLYERKEVKLNLNDKLKRKLISSIGKLDSISKIVKSEIESLQDSLRMLVLTDYIKKETVNNIGTDEKFNNISVVSVFETIRRNNPDVNIGILSGTLVVLPESCKEYLKENNITDFTTKRINDTNYCVYNFKGNNRDKVVIVGKIFSLGLVNILVGTKSLLGEGWDAPCINSLILASFVGSFMLSNQMRGRAIRIDKNNPDKVSNIWHLVTIEPEYMFEEKRVNEIASSINTGAEINSCDYDTLKRRFECFVGPHYSNNDIENGIDRVSILTPPFDEHRIDTINSQMLTMSKQRDNLANAWTMSLVKSSKMVNQNEVPKGRKAPSFNYHNVGMLLFFLILQALCVSVMCGAFVVKLDVVSKMLSGSIAFVILTILIFFTLFSVRDVFYHINPTKSIKSYSEALLRTLKNINAVSRKCKLNIKPNDNNSMVNVSLKYGTKQEQTIFNESIKELLSPIENPRYILVKKTFYNKPIYLYSLACPSVIGRKKEYVEEFEWNLRRTSGKYKIIYTRNEGGREVILKCRRTSYITYNSPKLKTKNRVSNYE